MTDHYLYDLIILISGIVIAAYLSLRIQQRMKNQDEKDLIKNVKEALFLEILQNIKTIDEEHGTISDEDGGRIVDIKGSLLNSAFESAVKSGKFLLLRRSDRNKLSVAYDMIEKSNFNGKQIVKFGSTLVPAENKDHFKKILETQVKRYVKQHKFIKEKLEELFEILNLEIDSKLKTEEQFKREALDKEENKK